MAKKPPVKTDLTEFFEHGKEASQAVRALSGRDVQARRRRRPQPAQRPLGRPSRASTGATEAADAPFPQLATAPTTTLYRVIRSIDDIVLLKKAHRYEAGHLRRQTVLLWIEDRLRLLGSPLGGPRAAPIAAYRRMDNVEVIDLLTSNGPEFAAEVYAWEHYHQRRPHVMRVAAEICGGAGDELVEQLAPFRGREDLPEPFAGFDALSTSPQFRSKLRSALRSQSQATLVEARAYETGTRNRVTMLQAIDYALRLFDGA